MSYTIKKYINICVWLLLFTYYVIDCVLIRIVTLIVLPLFTYSVFGITLGTLCLLLVSHHVYCTDLVQITTRLIKDALDKTMMEINRC